MGSGSHLLTAPEARGSEPLMSWVQSQMPNSLSWQSLWSTWLGGFCQIRDLCKLRQACLAVRYHLTATLACGFHSLNGQTVPTPTRARCQNSQSSPLSEVLSLVSLCVQDCSAREPPPACCCSWISDWLMAPLIQLLSHVPFLPVCPTCH